MHDTPLLVVLINILGPLQTINLAPRRHNSSDYKPVTINSDAVLQKADAYKSHHLKHKMLAT